ncbi:MAG: hypothetical protein M3P85_00475 [Actinomycetota bacterium]|nr:hypothetical protein [Actinomycetota bacterium]
MAIGVVVALVAGLFGLAAVTSDGGEDSPEAAVQKLVDALENEDVLGALEALVPAERTMLRGRLTELGEQLRRLGIVDERLDLGHVPGADLTVEGLELQAEKLGEDVAVVRAGAGTARLRIKGEELPIGPLLNDLVDDARTISSPSPADLAEEDAMLVAVRRGGDWFVSLGYTVAELARREGGAPVPKFGRGVAPKGASSPEAAVRELAAAAAAFDVRRAVELAPPGEADALHDYAPLFLPAAERAVASLRADGVRAEVPTLDLDVDSAGEGEARVTIKRLGVNVTTEDGRFAFDYDGRCTKATGPDGEVLPQLCRDDEDEELPFRRAAFSYFQLTVVERGGDWFVSPTGSVLDAVLGSLRALERDELAKVVKESPFALLFLVYPSPFLLGAGAFHGIGDIEDEENVSIGSDSECLPAEVEGTSDTEYVEVPCPSPAMPAPAVPPRGVVPPPPPPTQPKATGLSPRLAPATTTSAAPYEAPPSETSATAARS